MKERNLCVVARFPPALLALQLETLDHPGTTVSLVQISHLFIMKTSSVALTEPGNVS